MNSKKELFSTRNLVMMAVLTALQIILARFLSIQVNETLRISFETIPVALAGMWLGPLAGMLVALVSDILGTILSGYGVYFAPLSLGPMVFALICGVSVRYVFHSSLAERGDGWKVIATVVIAGVVNSFGIGLVATTLYQMIVVGKEGAFQALLWANLLQRLATKPLTIGVTAALVYLINRAAYHPVVEKIVKGTV
jgi:ECF transporter S component (folate family)